MSTTGGPLIVVSSPYAKRGELWETYRRHYGADGDARLLVTQGASRDFNPSVPQSVVDRALERDAAAARAEYLGQFRDDIAAFLTRDLVDRAVDVGVFERPPEASAYFGFVDMSGGLRDSSTGAVAHPNDNDVAVLDALIEVRAPHDPQVATARIADMLRGYGLGSVVGDKYAGAWVSEAFVRQGLSYEASPRDRSALYLEALPLFAGGKVRLLDNARLSAQLCNLERRTSAIGKDRVDHPPNSFDDVSNAAAGALVLAAVDPTAVWLRL